MLKVIVDTVASTLATFVVLAALFTLSGLGFGVALTGTTATAAGLIARRGPIAAARDWLRARRISRHASGPSHGSHDHGVHHVVVLLLYSTGAAVITVWVLRWQLEGASGAPYEHRVVLIGLGIIAAFTVYQVGPTGLLRAMKFGGMPRADPGGWPPPVPNVSGWTDRGHRFATSIDLYRFYLHGHLLKAAVWATVILLAANAMESAADSGSDTALGTEYVVSIVVLMLIEVLAGRQFKRRFRRLYALDLIAVMLEPRPARASHRHSHAAVAAPLSRRRLVAVVVAVERYAHSLQRRQGLAVRHSVAYLLRLSAAHLREHLSGVDSMSGAVSPEVEETLARTAALLAGKADLEFLEECESRLEYLSDRLVDAATPRAWSDRLTTGLELADKTTRLVFLISVVVLVLWLGISGEVSLKEVVELVP